jgi:hypothetical protein
MIQIRARYELMAAIDSELDNWCIHSWLNSAFRSFGASGSFCIRGYRQFPGSKVQTPGYGSQGVPWPNREAERRGRSEGMTFLNAKLSVHPQSSPKAGPKRTIGKFSDS